MATKTAAPGIHHHSPIQRAERHHDQEREADRDERAAEREPVVEQPLQVSDLGHVVAPLPPERDEPERELHEPHEPEPEHAEQHPGADRARGRFAGERGTPLRVDPEDEQERRLGAEPEQKQEPLEPFRPRDEAGAEDGVLVDRRQREVARDDRRKQQPGRLPTRPRSRRAPTTTRSAQAGAPAARAPAGAARPGPERRGRVPSTGTAPSATRRRRRVCAS